MFNQYFGFKSNPFGLAANFSFFRIDADKQAICNSMLRDLNNGCKRFLVTGVSGVGKSQFLRYLFTQLPSNTQSICLSGNTANYSDRIRFIIELTTENYQIGKKSLVVIDNAHEIPEDDLRLLFSLISQNNENVPIFPIIFCGVDTLEFKLTHLGFKPIFDDICCRYHVSELHEFQVRDYINFRLNSVGYDTSCKQELFSANVIKMITALSQGIPHSINLICGASLMIACLDNAWTVSEQIVEEAALSCLLTPKNTNKTPEAEQVNEPLKKSIVLIEQNLHKDVTNCSTQQLQLTSAITLPISFWGLFSLAIINRIKLPWIFNAKQNASPNKPKLQKKFEIEVLSGIGICFLGFSCLLIFNWFDHSNMAFRASKVLAVSEQPQNVDKNTVPTPAIVQINNQPFNSIKKTDANFLKVGEETSVKQAIANSKNALLSNSNPVDFVLFATDKVNFHPISTQYVPAMNQQKTSFVNTSTQQPEYRPEKLRHVVFVKPNLSFRVNPNRFSNKKATHSFIKNRNTGSNSVVDEMEVSVRERSSNRLKLNTLGIDFSVEALLSASRQGNLQAIKLMLAGGIPPDIKDAVLGVSPLLEGAKNGQLQVIQALLAKGANADIRNNEGQTALITAVKNNKKTVVKALLNGGADPSIADRNGRTALSYAVQTKNSEMISLLSRN